MEQNIITIDFNTFGLPEHSANKPKTLDKIETYVETIDGKNVTLLNTDESIKWLHPTDYAIIKVIETAFSSVDESAFIKSDGHGFINQKERIKRNETFKQLFKLRDANLILSEVYPSPKPLNAEDFKNAERNREDAFNELKRLLKHCPQIEFVRAGSLKDKPKFKTEYQLPIASLYDYLRKNKVIADSIDLETFTDSIMRGWFLPLWPEGTQVKLKRIAFHLKQYFEKKWFESVCNSIKQTKHEMSQTNFGSKNAKSKFDDEVLSILPKI